MSPFETTLAPLAYIDPGSGSLLLQVIVGAALGLLVTIKMYWARIKNFFFGDSKAHGDAQPDDQQSE